MARYINRGYGGDKNMVEGTLKVQDIYRVRMCWFVNLYFIQMIKAERRLL